MRRKVPVLVAIFVVLLAGLLALEGNLVDLVKPNPSNLGKAPGRPDPGLMTAASERAAGRSASVTHSSSGASQQGVGPATGDSRTSAAETQSEGRRMAEIQPLAAADPSQSPGPATGKDNRACDDIRLKIKKGLDVREQVKAGVVMNCGVCDIVKFALAVAGDLEGIVFGALEGGATADVVSRCAVDGGADAGKLASAFIHAGSSNVHFFDQEGGVGYSTPEWALVPMETTLPGGRTSPVSPSGF